MRGLGSSYKPFLYYVQPRGGLDTSQEVFAHRNVPFFSLFSSNQDCGCYPIIVVSKSNKKNLGDYSPASN